MTFQMNDKELKNKWLAKYKEEIDMHKEKGEKERQERVRQEQARLIQIRHELDDEKIRQIEKRKVIVQDELDEYYRHKINKQKEGIKYFEQKKNKDCVSLDMGYEVRLEKMKEHNNKLSELVDKNMDRFLNYQMNGGNETTNSKYEEFIKNNYTQLSKEYDQLYNRKATDIHQENKCNNSDDYLSKLYNQNFQKYKDVQKDVFNYNQGLINNKQRSKENQMVENMRTNEDRLRELDRLHYMEREERMVKDHRQKIYKTLLDDQTKITYSNNSSNAPHRNLPSDFYNSNSINNTPFISKKKDFNPNPYNNKRYELGETILEHNTILNPVHNFRYNRYLYNSHDNDASHLQSVGRQIIR